MLEKDFLRSYFRWTEVASEEELLGKQAKLSELLEKIRDPEVRRDTNYLLRLIAQELLSRHVPVQS